MNQSIPAAAISPLRQRLMGFAPDDPSYDRRRSQHDG